MGTVDIILLIVYIVGYVAHVVFAAIVGEADGDIFGFVFVGAISGIIWFVIDPIIAIALSGDLY